MQNYSTSQSEPEKFLLPVGNNPWNLDHQKTFAQYMAANNIIMCMLTDLKLMEGNQEALLIYLEERKDYSNYFRGLTKNAIQGYIELLIMLIKDDWPLPEPVDYYNIFPSCSPIFSPSEFLELHHPEIVQGALI